MIPPVSSPIPAVQYVRKSDDQHPIDDQKSAIKEYANSHGLAIVKTYAESQGKRSLPEKNW
jgi:DNA invertase Pin-like site-specific DNA recombinase